MIISMDEENKSFDKIEHIFMINVLKKLEIEGIYLNIIKSVYNNIILNGKN
jgi:hypothetical protein